MKALINSSFRWYYAQRYKQIERYMQQPNETQLVLFQSLISAAKNTEWGKKHDYGSIKTLDQYTERVPIQDYDSLKDDIGRMMYGERDVLWRGQIKWFSKSSGTTNDKSKFIPVTPESLRECHIKGTWDATALMYHNNPDCIAFAGKSLIMGGSHAPFHGFPTSHIGDVSAIMLEHTPKFARHFLTPDFKTALMPNFEEKLERMAQIICKENLIMFAGVPTWTVVLINRILEITGKNNLLDVFPNLQFYLHGGVSFTPYREQFKRYIPSETFIYQEIYNATEGFFAAQHGRDTNDMLLLLNNGIYYEFLPVEEWNKDFPRAIPLYEVELGKNYAIVISTNAGLWRYVPGDTVMFTSITPYKIRITGRTKQFVNAFGEEVMVDNTDKAIAETCKEFDAHVTDYTVAPIYFSANGKGGHEWLVEFEKMPPDLEGFNQTLDQKLQRINSDYEAKRFKSLALDRLLLRVLPKGTFHNWLRSKGKLGGQNKVPRLANHRQYVEEILLFANR